MIEPTLLEARWIAGALFSLVLVGLAVYARRVVRVARALGDRRILGHLVGIDVARPPLARLVAVGLAGGLVALAIVAAADPGERAGAHGPVVLVLDASGSMLVSDVGGTRLAAQQRIAADIAAGLGEVPVGVVAFAGRAFSLTPPTRDRGAIEMYLRSVDPMIVTQTGSAMGAAIRQGLGLLAASGVPAGTLILIGDGDETDDRDGAIAAATAARQARVRIHAVGIGAPAGGLVPAVDLTTGITEGYLSGSGGEPLISRPDHALLNSISSRTGGIHVRWDDPGASNTLLAHVADAPAGGGEPSGPPRYLWFAAGAMLLLAIEPLGERLRRRG